MTARGETAGMDAERLRELAGLGASWAATAFAQLVGHPVQTDLPTVHADSQLEQAGDWSTGLCFSTEGDFPGLVAVFVTPQTRESIALRLLGNPDLPPPVSAVRSALREFGNIVVSQTISAIANATSRLTAPYLSNRPCSTPNRLCLA